MSGGNWKEMFKAVETGDLELLKYHVRMGVDINYQHPEYFTAALIESIRLGKLEIAKYLLDNGAIPDIKEDFGGETPLEIAKMNKNEAAIKLLEQYLKKSV